MVLNLLEGIRPVRVRELLEFFGAPTKVLQASRAALTRVKGIGDDLTLYDCRVAIHHRPGWGIEARRRLWRAARFA